MIRSLCRVLLRLLFVTVVTIAVGVALAGDVNGVMARLSAGAWDGHGGTFSAAGLASAAAAELRRSLDALTRDHAEPRLQIEVERPSGPRGWTCKAITPSAVELRAQSPAGWNDAELRRKRWRAALAKSKGGEEAKSGFVEGKCVVGVRARGDAISPELAWDSSQCRRACTQDAACLGVLWGRVQTKDGESHRCFLSGTGDRDDIIGYPCQSSFWCSGNVSYTALTKMAPSLQCWQRQLWKCPVSKEDALNVALDTAKKAGVSCKATGNKVLDVFQSFPPINFVQSYLRSKPQLRFYTTGIALAIGVLLSFRFLARSSYDDQLRAEASAAAFAAGVSTGAVSVSAPAAAMSAGAYSVSQPPARSSSGAVPYQLSAEDAALFGSWREAPPSPHIRKYIEAPPSPHVRTAASPMKRRIHEEPSSPFVQASRGLLMQSSFKSPLASASAQTSAPMPSPLAPAPVHATARVPSPLAPAPAQASFSQTSAPQSPLGAAPQSPLGARLFSASAAVTVPTLAPAPEAPPMLAPVPQASFSQTSAPQSPLGAAPQSPLGARLFSAPAAVTVPTLAPVPEALPTLAPLPQVMGFQTPPVAAPAPTPSAPRRRAVAAAPLAPVAAQELAVVAIINDGGLDDLMALKGLGRVTANKILDYRRSGGQIQRLEDLVTNVGLPRKTIERVATNC